MFGFKHCQSLPPLAPLPGPPSIPGCSRTRFALHLLLFRVWYAFRFVWVGLLVKYKVKVFIEGSIWDVVPFSVGVFARALA